MHVASRRLSGDGTVVLVLPQSPLLAAMSAVVVTLSATAANAGPGPSTTSPNNARASTRPARPKTARERSPRGPRAAEAIRIISIVLLRCLVRETGVCAVQCGRGPVAPSANALRKGRRSESGLHSNTTAVVLHYGAIVVA